MQGALVSSDFTSPALLMRAGVGGWWRVRSSVSWCLATESHPAGIVPTCSLLLLSFNPECRSSSSRVVRVGLAEVIRRVAGAVIAYRFLGSVSGGSVWQCGPCSGSSCRVMKSQGFSSWAVSFGGRVAAPISHGIGGGVNRVAGYGQQQRQFPIFGLYKSLKSANYLLIRSWGVNLVVYRLQLHLDGLLGRQPGGLLQLQLGCLRHVHDGHVAVMSRDYVSGRGSRDVWTSDAALVGGGSETSGLATQIVWGVGAETFAFDAALEGGGTETDCTSDAAYASCLFMLELNFHSGSSIYSSQWFACLASHTSRSNSPVAHPSFFPCRSNEGGPWKHEPGGDASDGTEGLNVVGGCGRGRGRGELCKNSGCEDDGGGSRPRNDSDEGGPRRRDKSVTGAGAEDDEACDGRGRKGLVESRDGIEERVLSMEKLMVSRMRTLRRMTEV
ncbi:hypothetical protein DY000_02042404 [Brassica cretica]|uniref:Uncharacterized protein n=1 Tax=Brassica cretica TaxID=69181 RepID=A0ABQ7B5K1_BRACR|nr:hypothetical protein DY000_02042404 [Brassica cretica]